MGRAGLRHAAPLATATLMIAANLPDLDVLVLATDTPSVEFRRGWTHGVLGQLLLPVALAALMLLFARRRDRGVSAPRTFAALLGLSYLGIYSHVFLDWLNTYGVRLLAPVDWTWFYGDTLFIIDPWLWVTLGAGVWLSRRGGSPRAARISIVAASLYIAVMMVSASTARANVLDVWSAANGGVRPAGLMVGPVAGNPLAKQVIVDAGDHYELGSFTWLPPRVDFAADDLPKNDRLESVLRARQAPLMRSFLVWSRFPFYRVEDDAAGTLVSVGDVRFSLDSPLRAALGRGRFTVTTLVPRGGAAGAGNQR